MSYDKAQAALDCNPPDNIFVSIRRDCGAAFARPASGKLSARLSPFMPCDCKRPPKSSSATA
jgi:hypothetical protein